jgi:hypothetical protein
MSPEMQVVVEIAGAGMVLLFAALGALVSLMYLLTNPTIFGGPGREARRARRKARRLKKRGQPVPVVPDEPKVDARQERLHEQDRRRRAAALAAAIACAGGDAVMVFSQDAPADWRLLHRNLRLNQRVGRRPAFAPAGRFGQASPKPGGGGT